MEPAACGGETLLQGAAVDGHAQHAHRCVRSRTRADTDTRKFTGSTDTAPTRASNLRPPLQAAGVIERIQLHNLARMGAIVSRPQ